MRRLAVPAPESEAELLRRADALAGKTLGELAAEFAREAPSDLRRAKGWVGQLLEHALGATSASRARPDFEGLGVELKTLPVDRRGVPCESTFVCTIDMTTIGRVEWEHSRVRLKLARVLWVPVQGERTLVVGQRLIGSPLLWSPSPRDEADLRFDWEELASFIGRGDADSITGHLGKYLQVRPKAANSRSRRAGTDLDGRTVPVLPRGFYLRTSFTRRIVERHFALAGGGPPRREGGELP